jgi:hypothetical protein
MKNLTAQSPRVRMSDYKRFRIFAKNVHEKINVRANILHCGSPKNDMLILY